MKFIRRTHNRYSKIGKRRKKKQKWRRPTGRDNKMREKRKGYPAVVAIGYKQGEKKKFRVIGNLKQLEKAEKGEIIVIGNVGKKKKIEIVKKAEEKKIKIYRMNTEKFLRLNKEKGRKEEKKNVKGVKNESK